MRVLKTRDFVWELWLLRKPITYSSLNDPEMDNEILTIALCKRY